MPLYCGILYFFIWLIGQIRLHVVDTLQHILYSDSIKSIASHFIASVVTTGANGGNALFLIFLNNIQMSSKNTWPDSWANVKKSAQSKSSLIFLSTLIMDFIPQTTSVPLS